MTRLIWDADEIRGLIKTTENAEAHKGVYGQEPVPALLWVKDSGTYLMSSKVYEKGQTPSKAGEVFYAVGYGEDCDWDMLRSVCGGDDFAEVLELDGFPVCPDAKIFFIDVEDKKFTFGWVS